MNRWTLVYSLLIIGVLQFLASVIISMVWKQVPVVVPLVGLLVYLSLYIVSGKVACIRKIY